jgi:hypothetical protein
MSLNLVPILHPLVFPATECHVGGQVTTQPHTGSPRITACCSKQLAVPRNPIHYSYVMFVALCYVTLCTPSARTSRLGWQYCCLILERFNYRSVRRLAILNTVYRGFPLSLQANFRITAQISLWRTYMSTDTRETRSATLHRHSVHNTQRWRPAGHPAFVI